MAVSRAIEARRQLAACHWCSHDCGADRRSDGAGGPCQAPARSRLFQVGIEWAGEAALVPTATVSFSGCMWRCAFCLTGTESQDAGCGWPYDGATLAARLADLPDLRSVTILGGEPAIHLHSALDLIARLPSRLLVVWKTAAASGPAALALLDGQVDVVLADAKFGNDDCARRLAGAPRYLEVLAENLAWAQRQPRLMVRHLLMPGHLDCCTRPLFALLARCCPEAACSLMTGFLPRHGSAAAGLGRCNLPEEVAAARSSLVASGLQSALWSAQPTPPPGPAEDDLLIDPHGRILVDSPSPALLEALARLRAEMSFGA